MFRPIMAIIMFLYRLRGVYISEWGGVLKLYNTLILPTFLYGSENWTLTASQRRRIEAAEMKLLRPLAGYTL